MIVIVDYGRGNLFSLSQALNMLEKSYIVTDDPLKIISASRLILPGVGAFGDAMTSLRERKIIDPLHEAVNKGIPLLGICVGCQLLLEKSEEFGSHSGLSLIPGKVIKLPSLQMNSQSKVRVPNVGWRSLAIRPNVPILKYLNSNDWMYFVHSYAPSLHCSKHIAATTHINGVDIPAAIYSENILGVQFHPEKSGPSGLKLIDKFLSKEFI